MVPDDQMNVLLSTLLTNGQAVIPTVMIPPRAAPVITSLSLFTGRLNLSGTSAVSAMNAANGSAVYPLDGAELGQLRRDMQWNRLTLAIDRTALVPSLSSRAAPQ